MPSRVLHLERPICFVFGVGAEGAAHVTGQVTPPSLLVLFAFGVERLWGLMHKNVTHNRCYADFNGFCEAMLGFLREDVPKNWGYLCDSVSDHFRVISPKDFRILT